MKSYGRLFCHDSADSESFLRWYRETAMMRRSSRIQIKQEGNVGESKSELMQASRLVPRVSRHPIRTIKVLSPKRNRQRNGPQLSKSALKEQTKSSKPQNKNGGNRVKTCPSSNSAPSLAGPTKPKHLAGSPSKPISEKPPDKPTNLGRTVKNNLSIPLLIEEDSNDSILSDVANSLKIDRTIKNLSPKKCFHNKESKTTRSGRSFSPYDFASYTALFGSICANQTHKTKPENKTLCTKQILETKPQDKKICTNQKHKTEPETETLCTNQTHKTKSDNKTTCAKQAHKTLAENKNQVIPKKQYYTKHGNKQLQKQRDKRDRLKGKKPKKQYKKPVIIPPVEYEELSKVDMDIGPVIKQESVPIIIEKPHQRKVYDKLEDNLFSEEVPAFFWLDFPFPKIPTVEGHSFPSNIWDSIAPVRTSGWDADIRKWREPKKMDQNEMAALSKVSLANADKYEFKSVFKDVSSQVAKFEDLCGEWKPSPAYGKFDVMEAESAEGKRFYRKRITDTRLIAWHKYNLASSTRYCPETDLPTTRPVIKVRSNQCYKAEVVWRLNQTQPPPSIEEVLNGPVLTHPDLKHIK